MGKKLDVREYQCELIKVLDGDTIDCYIDLGFNLKVKDVRYMGIDTWESRTRDKEEKVKKVCQTRNKELLEQGVFKLKSFGQGKFGRVLRSLLVLICGKSYCRVYISNPDNLSIYLTMVGYQLIS